MLSHGLYLRSVQDTTLFHLLCEKSPTFLISCVYYIEELSRVRESNVLKANSMVVGVIDFLKVYKVNFNFLVCNNIIITKTHPGDFHSWNNFISCFNAS